ncbi:MAG: hypothetical protein J4F37_08595 [Acidobacteria bacterium]|nr:hypothetical protein [Acidobacteriota bacterium]
MTTAARRRAARAAALALLTAVAVGGARSAHAQGGEGRLSFSMGIDTSNAYFFRGIKQERSGLIVQPYADVSADLLGAGNESLSSLTLTVGQWNSLHSGPSGAGTSGRTTAMWYESDFFTGLTFGSDTLTAGVTYTSYLSPNDSFGTVQEVSLALSLDDSDRLLIPLQPHVGLAVELSGQADGGQSEGTYFELGIEPGLDLIAERASIGFPATLGLSLHHYYEDGGDHNDVFGYFDLGAVATLRLGMPEAAGTWTISAGVHLLALGDYLRVLNDGDKLQAVGAVGVNIAY